MLDSSIDEDGKDLIQKLLCKVPSERIGFGEGGFEKLKAHSFFKDFNWDEIHTMVSPLKGKNFFFIISFK